MRREIPSDIAGASGLSPEDRQTVLCLCETYRDRLARNYLRRGYYLMHQRPKELGIAVPPHLRKLEQVVGWPAKAVDSLANRSQFDGFVTADDSTTDALAGVVLENSLKRLYRQAVKSELQCCCAFLTVTAGAGGEPGVIVSAKLALAPGDPAEIGAQMQALMERRRASQPLDLPSAGSTFKRPAGHFAGPLIEGAGLKGQGVGGAQVSEKHAGFVVNFDHATAADVLATIGLVQKRVFETSGVHLEPEVRIW